MTNNPSEEYLKKIQADFVDKLNNYMNVRVKMEPIQIKAWTCALANHRYEDIKAIWMDFMLEVQPGYLPPIKSVMDMILRNDVRQREIFSNKKRVIEERQLETRPEEFSRFIKELQISLTKLKAGEYNMGNHYNHMADTMDGLDIKDGAREHRSLAKKWIAENPETIEKEAYSDDVCPI